MTGRRPLVAFVAFFVLPLPACLHFNAPVDPAREEHPKSVVAKFTPHFFHVFVYRRLGFENAGKPGYGPFPTYLRWSLRQSALERWAGRRGLEVVESRTEPGRAFEGRPVLGRLSGRSSELRLVLRRPGRDQLAADP